MRAIPLGMEGRNWKHDVIIDLCYSWSGPVLSGGGLRLIVNGKLQDITVRGKKEIYYLC